MYRVLRKGICRTVSLPSYGDQDRGVSPGGAMDLFSFRTGNILLGNPEDAPALEMLFPPILEFEEDTFFALAGGAYRGTTLASPAGVRPIRHGVAYRAAKGSVLSFGKRSYGFRTYLCCRAADGLTGAAPEGRDRGAFGKIARWMDPRSFIRAVEGPEFDSASHAQSIFAVPWTISRESSAMGLRLENPGALLRAPGGNMVSAPVATGTVQLTPKGPIVLLKDRQTVGGYPRILTIASADTDLLAQYAPGQKVRFKRISGQEAVAILRRQKEDIDALKVRFGG